MPDPAPGPHILVAAVSARALAWSASQAGYRVTAVDSFGDMDLRAHADVVTLSTQGQCGFDAMRAADETRHIPADLVVYGASFENVPRAIARLAQGRRLLGNSPDVVTRVRDPVAVMQLWDRLGFAVPVTRASAPAPGRRGQWLVKPRRSGCGNGIALWRRGTPVGRDHYLQEWIDGVPGSITFVANGHSAMPLGLSRQLIGDNAFGTRDFQYCGSLIGDARVPLFEQEDQLRETAAALADTLTAAFGLVGVNGIDFIARGGIPYPIEVNPRYSASMELIERRDDYSIFDVHARACLGTLPSTTPWTAPPKKQRDPIIGKAIVYAARDVTVLRPADWPRRARWAPMFADIPMPGSRIVRGRPICTVFARGVDAATCRNELARSADGVRTDLASHQSETLQRSLFEDESGVLV